MMKLWTSKASPYARKTGIVLREKKLQDDVQETFVHTTPFQSDPDLKAQNPLGKVPCLTIDNDQIVVDSGVICRYFDSIGQGLTLFPSGNVHHETLVALADGILDSAVPMVYEKRYRPENMQFEPWLDAQWQKISDTLRYIEIHYQDVLAHFNGAVIGVVCAIEYLDFRHDTRNWRQYAPELAKWHEGVKDRESFVATRPQG